MSGVPWRPALDRDLESELSAGQWRAPDECSEDSNGDTDGEAGQPVPDPVPVYASLGEVLPDDGGKVTATIVGGDGGTFVGI